MNMVVKIHTLGILAGIVIQYHVAWNNYLGNRAALAPEIPPITVVGAAIFSERPT